MKKALAVAKINFRMSRLAYLIFLVTFCSVLINVPINLMVEDSELRQVSPGLYSYLLVILFAIFIPALHFRKFMNLNVKKAAYIQGCAVNYVGVALFASAFNLLSYYTLDRMFTIPPKIYMMNLLDIFGWAAGGPVVAFLRQFAFLLLVAVAVHLITTIQSFWYGWAVDLAIAAILSVFIPIPALRGALLAFFNLIIFTPNALLQIAACLVLSAGLYLLSVLPVKQKPV